MVLGTGLLGGAIAALPSAFPYVTLFFPGKVQLFVDFITHIQPPTLNCPTV